MGDRTRRRAGHAARRLTNRGWFGYGRTRALLTLGMVAVLGVTGTSASWTDTATVSAGGISSGSLDLELRTPDNSAWSHSGGGTVATDPTLTVSDLTPGERVAFDFGARNKGNPDFRYSATVARAAPWGYSGAPILVRFHTGTANNPTVSPRTGSCSGTALGGGAVAVTNTPQTVIPERLLTGGGDTTDGQSENLCLVVSMATDATNVNQDKSGTLRLEFVATQVAP